MNDGSPKDTSHLGSTSGSERGGPPPDPYLGTTLKDRYRIERILGRGGLGAVYLARDLQLHDKPVVVKVMRDNPTVGADWVLKKFREEIKALARIDHPGVVGALDAGETSDRKPYIVMQYVEGRSLRSVMRDGPLSHERVARLIRQLGQALGAAHDKGVVHRDLKPENIMVHAIGPDEEYARLIDFGISTVRDLDAADGPAVVTTVAGTVFYMAPEQLEGRPVPASDIYALGIVAYELLTGTTPFRPASPYQLLELQRNHTYRLPSEIAPMIPPAAQAAIVKALSFRPADRYPSARLFGDELARALTADSPATSPVASGTAAATVHESGPGARATSRMPDSSAAATSVASPGTGETVPETMPTEETNGGRPSRVPLLLGIAGLAAVAAVVFWYVARVTPPVPGPGTNAPLVANGNSSPAPAAQRELSYAIQVQKVRDGKDFEAPFILGGEILFERDYKIRVLVTTREQGYLYILNEGEIGPDGKPTVNVLFPSTTSNGGSSAVAPNTTIQIPRAWFVLDAATTTEKLWLVWTAQPVPELEAVKGLANPVDRGAILKPEQLAAVRSFMAGAGASKAGVEHVDNGPQDRRTVLRATGDVLVHVVPLAHN